MAKEEEVTICFLHTDTSKNEVFSAADIGYHPRLMKEREMLSSTHITAALTRTMNDSFLNKIRVAGKEDEKWQDRGREMVKLREGGKKVPDEWIGKDGLLYYKNPLSIPENEALQTEIAQGCHDSLVAVHFGQEKRIEIVTGVSTGNSTQIGSETMYDPAMNVNTVNPTAGEVPITSTLRSTLCRLGLHINRLHHPTARSAG